LKTRRQVPAGGQNAANLAPTSATGAEAGARLDIAVRCGFSELYCTRQGRKYFRTEPNKPAGHILRLWMNFCRQETGIPAFLAID
jgi:hypothetical protein